MPDRARGVPRARRRHGHGAVGRASPAHSKSRWRDSPFVARAAPPSRLDGLVRMGVDETGYKKGHKYMTVVLDHDRGIVAWCAKGHGKEVLRGFFERLDEGQRASIGVVTTDEPLDRGAGRGALPGRRARHGPCPRRLLDERRAGRRAPRGLAGRAQG